MPLGGMSRPNFTIQSRYADEIVIYQEVRKEHLQYDQYDEVGPQLIVLRCVCVFRPKAIGPRIAVSQSSSAEKHDSLIIKHSCQFIIHNIGASCSVFLFNMMMQQSTPCFVSVSLLFLLHHYSCWRQVPTKPNTAKFRQLSLAGGQHDHYSTNLSKIKMIICGSFFTPQILKETHKT